MIPMKTRPAMTSDKNRSVIRERTTSPTVAVTLREWESVSSEPGSPLHGVYLPEDQRVRRAAEEIAKRGMLRLTEARHGLAVTSTSFVGRVRLGNLTITVQPKITGVPLMRLLAYAYNLRDLTRAGSGATEFAVKQGQPFQDLLVYQLATEMRELTARGLRREYTRAEQQLTSPRGRIDIGRLAREGAGGRFFRDGTLPCIMHERSGDTALNRALRAGLALGAQLTDDAVLRTTLRRLDSLLEAAGAATVARRRTDINGMLRRAHHEQSRLTAAYDPALTLIGLLNSAAGPTLDEADESGSVPLPLPGFLFDMNRLFQAVLLRFLTENLPAAYTIQSERGLRHVFAYDSDWNPNGRRMPTPRPDFAITSRGETVMILDAKYRDLWEHSLPHEMLYQLTIYALSQSGARREAAILYPTMTAAATEARIHVRDPARANTDNRSATVVLRPVNLPRLAALIHDRSPSASAARAALAESMAFGSGDKAHT